MLEPKLVWTSALLMLGVLRLAAQTNVLDVPPTPPDTQTNLPVIQTNIYIALNANFRLTAEVQATPQTVTNVTITTRDLIQAIGAATGNHFSPHARLVLLFRDIGGVPFFVIRDGTNELNTAEFLTASQNSTPLARLHQRPKGVVTGTVYCEEGFRLDNLMDWDFEVQGFNVAQQSNRGNKGELLPVYGPTSLQIHVLGPGTVAGKPAIVQGLFLASGRKLELRVEEQ
jgi:hypothetical protein